MAAFLVKGLPNLGRMWNLESTINVHSNNGVTPVCTKHAPEHPLFPNRENCIVAVGTCARRKYSVTCLSYNCGKILAKTSATEMLNQYSDSSKENGSLNAFTFTTFRSKRVSLSI